MASLLPAPVLMNNTQPIMSELPTGRCGELCESCVCPCYIFGKLISKLKLSELSTVDQTACVSWGLILLVFWGGIAAAVQIMIAQLDVSGSVQYAVYGLYVLYYIVYLFPFLQVLPLYRSLKWIHGNGGAQPGMAVQEAPEACHQCCMFMICPCTFLASAHRFVDLTNGFYGNGTKIVMEKEVMACPCGGSANMQVISSMAANNNNQPPMMMMGNAPPMMMGSMMPTMMGPYGFGGAMHY
jgi:hypothetical protein